MASSSTTVVTYWQKYGHLVLDNCLGSLPRNSVDRLTARHDLNSVNLAINQQNKLFVAVIYSDITLSCDYLSQKIIYNVPRKG